MAAGRLSLLNSVLYGLMVLLKEEGIDASVNDVAEAS